MKIGVAALGAAMVAASVLPFASVLLPAPVSKVISPAPFAPSLRLPVFARLHRSRRQNPLVGFASWYGAVLRGRSTADGGVFDENEYTAAHNSLPFGTHVRVIDTDTGRSVVVRITDRGILSPGRVIDLSSAAAEDLGILEAGVAHVKLQVLAREQNEPVAGILPAALNPAERVQH